ncbi:hypothetical protein D3C81_1159580 [compost metagenome]
MLVAGAQVLGALGDAPLQLAVGLLQRLAGGQAGGQRLASLVPGDQQEGQQGEGHRGEQAVAGGGAAHLLYRREQGELPRRVVEAQGLRQVGQRPRAVGARQGQQFGVGGQALAAQRLQLLEAGPAVLQAGGQLRAARGIEGLHRLEAPRRVAGEDDDAVVVADEGLQLGALPALLQRVEADLHHCHADDLPVVAQAVGQVVAGLAGGAADAVEAPGPALQGVLEVGAEGQVLALEAVGIAPVAGGQHPAAAVEQVDRAAAAALVEAFEVLVDPGAARLARRQQQAADAVFKLQQAGQVGVGADRAFHRARVQLQLALAAVRQGAQAGLLAQVVGEVAAAEHQQDGQQRQVQGREQARVHGQRGRQRAGAGMGGLHHNRVRAASVAPGWPFLGGRSRAAG